VTNRLTRYASDRRERICSIHERADNCARGLGQTAIGAIMIGVWRLWRDVDGLEKHAVGRWHLPGIEDADDDESRQPPRRRGPDGDSGAREPRRRGPSSGGVSGSVAEHEPNR
jgi:hypothetical protein